MVETDMRKYGIGILDDLKQLKSTNNLLRHIDIKRNEQDKDTLSESPSL